MAAARRAECAERGGHPLHTARWFRPELDQTLGTGQYDLIVLNDVMEHIYDTAGLLHNCRSMLKEGGLVYFKVPNGLSINHVLSEGHKKAFGVSLLPPDYWAPTVKAPFSIYYRRLEYFEALFSYYGFAADIWIRHISESSTNSTVRDGLARIGDSLSQMAPANRRNVIDSAIDSYFAEVESRPCPDERF